jgi:uncharacterized membrane protein YhaH (DUF805 family)
MSAALLFVILLVAVLGWRWIVSAAVAAVIVLMVLGVVFIVASPDPGGAVTSIGLG